MRTIKWYMIAVGLMDALTGILLVTVPLKTLALMGLSGRPIEPVYLQWIGVFVYGVGLAYFLPFWTSAEQGRSAVLRFTLLHTALVRASVALFLTWTLLNQRLENGWLLVLLTDGVCAVAQLMFLRWEVLRDPHHA